jgi:hypothetical protein
MKKSANNCLQSSLYPMIYESYRYFTSRLVEGMYIGENAGELVNSEQEQEG